MRYLVEWDFSDTEFEELQYEEAVEQAGLPNYVNIDIDEDETIEDHLLESYGFEISSYEED